MDHPERARRFLQRVDFHLDQYLLEEKDSHKAPRPKSSFLSQEQLDAHYDDHYLGYLKGLKEAEAELESGKNTRQALLNIAFNYNGAHLHEIYFDCLNGKSLSQDLAKTLGESFGSKDKMMKQLEDALMVARSGWAYMGYDPRSESFRVGMIDQHDCHLPLWQPVLALDVWEHAFYIDFKTDKKKYVKSLLEDINWDAVGARVDKVL